MFISTHIENSEKFLEFFEVYKDCFMPPEFFNDNPYDYNEKEIIRVQRIIENVIKSTDSRDVILDKKNKIR